MRATAGCWAVVMVTTAAAVLAAPQTPAQRPTFRSGVQLVEIDVRPADRSGRFVPDLGAGDFEVFEDGVPQPIAGLQIFGPGSRPASRPHTWLLQIDTAAGSPATLNRARLALEAFVSARLPEGDVVGIIAGHRLLGDQLTSNHAEVLAALRRLNVVGMTEPLVPGPVDLLRTMTRLATGMREVAGTKTLVLFAQTDLQTRASGAMLRSTIDRLREADIRVYTVDAAGLERWAGSDNGGLAQLAHDTGGLEVRRENNFDRALETIAADAGSYYLLSYRSTNATFDGTYRHITVRTSRPDVIVRARAGYVAVHPDTLRRPR